MTQVYRFKFGYTKLGNGVIPSTLPTITIDNGTNILVTGSSLLSSPIVGEFRYYYTGTSGLDLVGAAYTPDATVDQQTLFSVPDLISYIPDISYDVWAYASRTLTQTLASIVSSLVSVNTLTILRGDTVSLSISGLGNLVGISKLYFSVKSKEHDTTDAGGMLQIEKTAGLIHLNGQPSTPINGSIFVNDNVLGNITIGLLPIVSSQLPLGTHNYDIQRISSSGTVSTLALGDFTVALDVTKATS